MGVERPAPVDAGKWAAWKYEELRLENRWREAYQGMLRKEPWPPQGRVPSFVWELRPNETLRTEYARGLRFAKFNW